MQSFATASLNRLSLSCKSPSRHQRSLRKFGRFWMNRIFVRYDDAMDHTGSHLSQFQRLMHHQIRGPLMSLTNCVEILKLARFEPQGVAAVAEIDRQVRLLTRLLDHSMWTSQIADDKQAEQKP